MTLSDEDKIRIRDWVIRSLSGEITTQEGQQLDQLLNRSAAARAYYLDFLGLTKALRESMFSSDQTVSPEALDTDRHRSEDSLACVRHQKIRRYRILAAAAGILILFSLLIGIQLRKTQNVVATLGHTQQARWSSTPDSQELQTGSMHLEEGCAEIVFHNGAQVIVQAPSAFKLLSSSTMLVESGTVSARVPKPALGFTIEASGMTLVDYGTEFGVITHRNGQAEVHVFDGEVGITGRGAQAFAERRLTTGAVAIIGQDGTVQEMDTQARKDLFVCRIPAEPALALAGRKLDLGDVVNGGNGYGTGIPTGGLDPATGRVLSSPSRRLITDPSAQFHKQLDCPYIDGLFIPNEGTGAVSISSSGLVFQECPPTDGCCIGGIHARVESSEKLDIPLPRAYLEDNPRLSLLNMHPNLGITFDLDRIRQNHPGQNIRRFRSWCGLAANPDSEGDQGTDFWVLLDGQVYFHTNLTSAGTRWAPVNVSVNPTQRFLTLVTTTSYRVPSSSGLFAETVLEFAREN